MENTGNPYDPYEIEVIVPQSIELIDPRYDDTLPPPRREPPQFRPLKSRKRLALILFVATCLSTALMGGLYYAVPVMLILFAHEMGHYLQARRYGVPASLPYFIPMPFTPLGTMGAVIVQGGGVADRKQMFDIAITGPLAGLIFALPVAYWGILTSKVGPLPVGKESLMVFGDPLIFQWMAAAIHGPIPKGSDLMMNPLCFAGWVGVFITALNLIPIGQLDGGHILYTMIGKRAHVVALGLLWATVAYMIYSEYYAYILMVLLLLLMGPKHPPTRDDTVPLGVGRYILGWLTLAFIVIGFTPTPIIQ